MSKTVQVIQFSINTQFSSIRPIDRTLIRIYHSGPNWTCKRLQWRGTPRSPKFQHYWNLTIRFVCVISSTLVGRGLTPLQRCSWYILQPQPTGQVIYIYIYIYNETIKQNKIKLVIYLPKFNTTKLVIYNNFSPSTNYLSMTNVTYQFKFSLGKCFFKKVITCIGLTTKTLWRRLTLYISDRSSIFQHLKIYSCGTNKYRKILTEKTSKFFKVALYKD